MQANGPNTIKHVWQPGPMYASKVEPTKVKHLSGAPLKGWHPALPMNIRLSLKCFQGTNIPAYLVNYSKKGYINLGPRLSQIG